MKNRFDGYMNLLSGLGAPGLDRTMSGVFTGTNWGRGLDRFWNARYTQHSYGDIYYTNGLAQKIIDRPADDAFSNGIEIEGDDDDVMSNEYDRLAVLPKMADAIRWARLYGGAVLLLIAKDGGELTDPLNLDTLDEITEIRVFDVTCLKNPGRYYDDPANPNLYGKLEYYTLTPPGATSFDVHETRLIPVGSDPVPVSFNNLTGIPWMGRPVLESCMNDILRYGQALEWGLRLLERKQQAVYQMEGLGQMLANQDDLIVQKRVNMVDMVRGILNSVVIDKEDAYQVQNLGLDGIQPLLDEYQVALSASSNMPIVILFGKSSQGLNSTGEGDLENYYKMVEHIRSVIAKPSLEKLTAILWVQKSLQGKIPDEWKIEYNPLWVPTQKEQAETDQAETTAQTNTINNLVTLLNNEILSPEEVRKVVVNEIYNEYGFKEDKLPTSGQDVNYAEGVDLSMLKPTNPNDTNAKKVVVNAPTN